MAIDMAGQVSRQNSQLLQLVSSSHTGTQYPAFVSFILKAEKGQTPTQVPHPTQNPFSTICENKRLKPLLPMSFPLLRVRLKESAPTM
jgi:hypothetical protein